MGINNGKEWVSTLLFEDVQVLIASIIASNKFIKYMSKKLMEEYLKCRLNTNKTEHLVLEGPSSHITHNTIQ